MRTICVITSIHPDYDPRVYKHCLSLCDHGFNVIFISPWSDEALDKRICHLRFPRSPGILGRFRNMWHIWQLLSETNCDLYHFHDLDILPLMALFEAISGKSVVYDVHENYSLEMLEKPSVPKVLRWPLYWLTLCAQRFCCAVIRNVVVVVDSITRDLYQPSLNIIRVRNLASKQICTKAKDDYMTRAPAVLFLAGQYISNGSLVFMDIAERVVRQRPDVRFYTIDRFSKRDNLRQVMMERASGTFLKDRIEFLPLIPSTEVPRYINLVTVGLYLGLDVPKQTKALPTKLFEYMGCGVPIVASDLPYCREFVTRTNAGLLAKPGDPDDFAEKICRLLDDRKHAGQLGENGRKVIFSSLNWETEMDRLMEYYRKIFKIA